MNKKIKNWWEQAVSDLAAAQSSLKEKKFDWACFQSQQAVEKALKSIYLAEYHELKKVHDLMFLGRKLQLPEGLIQFCIKLNKVYIETRYPDYEEEIPAKRFLQSDAEDAIKMAEEILQWLQKKL